MLTSTRASSWVDQPEARGADEADGIADEAILIERVADDEEDEKAKQAQAEDDSASQVIGHTMMSHGNRRREG